VIAVENIFERSLHLKAPHGRIVVSPNFGICVDAGHLRVFSKVDMEEWFAVGPRIAGASHDNHGKHDDHLPLGEGSIDIPCSSASRSTPMTRSNDEPHGEGHEEGR
jgi:sugar phosphate isomerase/epimerase